MTRCKFDVVQGNGAFPSGFEMLPFTKGFHQAALRVGGGCGYADPEIMRKVPEYVLEAFEGVNCTIVSGGTLSIAEEFDETLKRTVYKPAKFMITLIPALLKTKYEVLAASTTPRTAQMELDEHFGGLIVGPGKDDYRIDYRQDRAILWQKDATEIIEADWVGDVLPFLKIHSAWQNKGLPCAWWGIEGGGGTYKEVIWYLQHGIPCILTDGSGRKSDELCAKFAKGELTVPNLKTGDEEVVDPALVTVVPFLDAKALNKALRDRKIIVKKTEAVQAA
jgi:hypothetical protein